MKDFVKMTGVGNDYVYFNCLTHEIFLSENQIKNICNRHFGVGGDGVVLIKREDGADCRMEMFNSDGSRGAMCGNAVRCVGRYLHEYVLPEKNSYVIATDSGNKQVFVSGEEVGVNMGVPDFNAHDVGIDLLDGKNKKSGEFFGENVQIDGKTFALYCVSMGNPHCVVFAGNEDFEKYASKIQQLDIFKRGVNVEFITDYGKNYAKVRVFERGSGETLSCGTGACAVVSVMCRLKKFERNVFNQIILSGGKLNINFSDSLFMTGETRILFTGKLILK